jgi:hypothetical protein
MEARRRSDIVEKNRSKEELRRVEHEGMLNI